MVPIDFKSNTDTLKLKDNNIVNNQLPNYDKGKIFFNIKTPKFGSQFTKTFSIF